MRHKLLRGAGMSAFRYDNDGYFCGEHYLPLILTVQLAKPMHAPETART